MKIENMPVAEWLEKTITGKPLNDEQKEALARIESNPNVLECLVGFAGTTKRREDFKNGKPAETLPETLERFGARGRRCHNCAFNRNSEEMKEYRAEYPSQVSTILENIDLAIEGNAPFEPFFCHQGMPTNNGGKSFQPEYTEEGLPKGFPICAGWRNEAEKSIKRYAKISEAEETETAE